MNYNFIGDKYVIIHNPKIIHIVSILFPPLYIVQRSALQWGDGAKITEDNNPDILLGTHHKIYKWAET